MVVQIYCIAFDSMNHEAPKYAQLFPEHVNFENGIDFILSFKIDQDM